MIKALIHARNYNEYKSYVMANNLRAWEYPYIGNYRHILGYANIAMYVLNTAADNPEHNAIMLYAQTHDMTITQQEL